LSSSITMTELNNLLAIPLVMIFYLFGKVQYQRLHYKSLLLDSEKQEKLKAQADDQAVANFINNLLDKRLPMLEYLLTFPEKNMVTIQAEIQLLKEDLQKLLKEVNYKTTPVATPNKKVEDDELLVEAEAEILIKAIDEET